MPGYGGTSDSPLARKTAVVRSWPPSGKHMLDRSITGHDPTATSVLASGAPILPDGEDEGGAFLLASPTASGGMLHEIDTIGRACGGGKFAQYSPLPCGGFRANAAGEGSVSQQRTL